MRPIPPGKALIVLLLLRSSTGQSSCGRVFQTEGSSGQGIPVAGCPPETATGDSSGEEDETSINSAGETVVSNGEGVLTIPASLKTMVTLTRPDTEPATNNPETAADLSLTAADPASGLDETVISNRGTTVTLPAEVTTPVVLTNSDGEKTTYDPLSTTDSPQSDLPGGDPEFDADGFSTFTSDGETLVSDDSSIASTLKSTDGQQATNEASSTTASSEEDSSRSGDDSTTGSSITTNSASETIISFDSGAVTIPTGATTPIPITKPDGEESTYIPAGTTRPSDTQDLSSSDSSTGAAVLIPVTTSVSSPGKDISGAVIPCSVWFFNMCIEWDDDSIVGGWKIDGPPGTYAPGPPPPFTSGPGLSIEINGPTPTWPRYTIGPENNPNFPSEPTNGPDDGCKSTSADYTAETTSYGVSTSGDVTTTTTSTVLSTTGKLYGCKASDTSTATATTSTCTSTTAGGECVTASAYPYVVYPEDGKDTAQVEQIAELLSPGYVRDSSQLKTSKTDSLGIVYWQLPLNETAADEVRKIDHVASVEAQCDPLCSDESECIVCYDPTLSLKYQKPAPNHLRFVSWPPSSESLPEQYTFDDSNGKGVVVYILDTGANLESPEFQNERLVSRNNVRWIHVGEDEGGGHAEDDSRSPSPGVQDPEYTGITHGTAMLSLVAGNTLGVAKRISPVVVRLPRRNAKKGGNFQVTDFLDALNAIEADVETLDEGVSAIVLIAHFYGKDAFRRLNPRTRDEEKDESGDTIYDFNGWPEACRKSFAALVAKNVLAVVGAGNSGSRRPGQNGPIDGWPQNFAKRDQGSERIDRMLVVGGLSNDYEGPAFARGPNQGIPTVYAPAVDIKVAKGQPDALQNGDAYRDSAGTSDSSAIVAGLAAYFLSLGRSGNLPGDQSLFENTPEGLKRYIEQTAFTRKPTTDEDIKGIWNKVSGNAANDACLWEPAASLRRLRARADTCVKPSNDEKPTSASASSTTEDTTSTGSAKPTSESPSSESKALELSDRDCKEEDDFPRHGSVKGYIQRDKASDFCKKVKEESEYLQPGQAYSAWEQGRESNWFWYSVRWAKDCVATADRIQVDTPTGDDEPTCFQLLKGNRDECDNGDLGGSISVGCVEYTYIGGLSQDEDKPKCDDCTEVDIRNRLPPPGVNGGPG